MSAKPLNWKTKRKREGFMLAKVVASVVLVLLGLWGVVLVMTAIVGLYLTHASARGMSWPWAGASSISHVPTAFDESETHE